MNCIHVFDKEGRYLRQMGVKGTSPGQFQAPEGLAVDARGFIYVADTCNDRVQVGTLLLRGFTLNILGAALATGLVTPSR